MRRIFHFLAINIEGKWGENSRSTTVFHLKHAHMNFLSWHFSFPFDRVSHIKSHVLPFSFFLIGKAFYTWENLYCESKSLRFKILSCFPRRHFHDDGSTGLCVFLKAGFIDEWRHLHDKSIYESFNRVSEFCFSLRICFKRSWSQPCLRDVIKHENNFFRLPFSFCCRVLAACFSSSFF